jgi:hypothetical protein
VEPIVLEPIVPVEARAITNKPETEVQPNVTPECVPTPSTPPAPNKSYEEMTIEELQSAILARMAQNGPVTDRMRKDVIENVYHNSLVNWIKSFR